MLVIAAYEMRPPRRLANQGGMAVAIALLILALLSLLGITLMGLSLTESQIGSNESDLKKALFAAEAGIQEAMYRMRLPATLPNESTACTATADPVVIGKVVDGVVNIPSLSSGISNNWNYNPFSLPVCSWTYSGNSATGYGNYFGGNPGTPPGDLDNAGRTLRFCAAGDTSAYCESATYSHKMGNALANANITNTVSDARSYTVTIASVVGFVGGCWQYVDQFGNALPLAGAAVPCAADAVPNNPMYKVTSIGTAKNSQKVLSTMIRRFNVNPKPDAPLTANSDVEVTSATAVVDGRDYKCNGFDLNPTNPDNKPAVAAAPKPPPNETQPDIVVNHDSNLVCAEGTGIGIGSCGRIREAFPSTIGELLLGHPYKNDTSPPPTQARLAEIDAFNAYLESIKVSTGPPENGPPFHGIVYVNGNYAQPPDLSSGILIVHNATNTANLGNWNGGTFTGVVVADSINKINGNVTIIGAIYGWGSSSTVEVDITAGTPQIKYSKCVLDGLPQIFPFEVVKGTWHEQ